MGIQAQLKAGGRGRPAALTATVVASLLAGGTAFAQAGDPPSAAVEASGIEDIVVTARRRSEDLQRQPLSVSALTASALESRNVIRLDDVASVPNVNFNNQVGFVNTMVPFIRGIGEQDPILTNDAPVSVYVDGVLMARSIGSLIELIDPERIEILRGPQGSLFGRNTTGGAISITTALPRDEAGIKLRAGYATDDETTLRATIDTGLFGGDGLKARLSYQHYEVDGWTRNTRTDDERLWGGAQNSDAVYFHLHAMPGAAVTFDFRLDYTTTRTTLPNNQLIAVSDLVRDYFGQSPNFGGDPLVVSPTRVDALPLYPEGPRSRGKFFGTSFTLDIAGSEAFNVKSISAYRRLRTNTAPNTIGSGDMRGPVIDFETGEVSIQPITPISLPFDQLGYKGADVSYQRQYSQELQLSGKVGRHSYVAGVFYFDEKVSERYITPLTIPIPGLDPENPDLILGFNTFGGTNYRGRSKSLAFYLSDSYTPPILDDRLEITGGIRYTEDKKSLEFLALPPIYTVTSDRSRKFSQLSGDVTVKFQWTPDVMTYFRWANGYKSGGFSGRDAQTSPGFKPEVANNFEVGLKSTMFDRRVRFNASAFYTKYNDKQVTTFLGRDPISGINASAVANAAKTTYVGVEAELTVVPVEGFTIDSTFGYTKPKYKSFLFQIDPDDPDSTVDISDQARFQYFSRTTFSIGAGYTFPTGSFGVLSLRADYSYKSGMYFHPSDLFSPLNEIIKAGARHDVTANITLSEIPLFGTSNTSITLYAKNLLNKKYRIQAVDYQIAEGVFFGSAAFARPRVIGVNMTTAF